MKKINLYISFFYAIFQITQGLLLHPYQTMQSLVRDKVFIWMSLIPTAVLAITTLIWRIIIVPLVRLFFSCQRSDLFVCDLLPFISNCLTFFCIYWQLFLLYFLFRFTKAFE